MTNNQEFEPLAVPVATGSAMIGIGHTKTYELLRD